MVCPQSSQIDLEVSTLIMKSIPPTVAISIYVSGQEGGHRVHFILCKEESG